MSMSPPPDYGNVAPPKYEDVPAEPPPSYDSLFGEIRQARDESSGTMDFLQKFMTIVISTIGCTVFLAILLAIPIACIVIGAKHLDDCPIQSKIPIYLIVLGAFGILRNMIGLYQQGKKRFSNTDYNEEGDSKKCYEGLIDCFLVAWFIAGNVWIYSNYEPNYVDVNSSDYCDKTLYLFAFGLTTASYAFVGCICCCMCCVAFCSVLAEG